MAVGARNITFYLTLFILLNMIERVPTEDKVHMKVILYKEFIVLLCFYINIGN